VVECPGDLEYNAYTHACTRAENSGCPWHKMARRYSSVMGKDTNDESCVDGDPGCEFWCADGLADKCGHVNPLTPECVYECHDCGWQQYVWKTCQKSCNHACNKE